MISQQRRPKSWDRVLVSLSGISFHDTDYKFIYAVPNEELLSALQHIAQLERDGILIQVNGNDEYCLLETVNEGDCVWPKT